MISNHVDIKRGSMYNVYTLLPRKKKQLLQRCTGLALVLKRMQGKEKSKKAANTNHITHTGMLCNGNGLNMFMIK